MRAPSAQGAAAIAATCAGVSDLSEPMPPTLPSMPAWIDAAELPFLLLPWQPAQSDA